MGDSIVSESLSLQSFSVPLSITSETREKFDAILESTAKCAGNLLKKEQLSKSRENLLKDDASATGNIDNLMGKNKEEGVNFILNKFLKQSNEGETAFTSKTEEPFFAKPPVPKPRKKTSSKVQKLMSPTSSQGTFDVASPKILRVRSRESVASNQTYHVSRENGGATVELETLAQKSCVEKADIEILNDDDDQISTESISTVGSKGHKASVRQRRKDEDEKFEENIEMVEIRKDLVEVTNEKAKCRSSRSKRGVSSKARHSPNEEIVLDQSKTYSYEKILEVIIHRTQRLELTSLVVHPVVKMHMVDIETGKYIKKSDKDRPVVFFYENEDCDYISPVMTRVYNLQENRSLHPAWEETILINEDYNYIVDERKRIIVFFEILDFVPFSMVNQSASQKGWHNIAFAFLKLAGKGNAVNIGKKVRLQLYYWHPSKKETSHICSVWSWWKKANLKKYPSTLFVTIRSVTSPSRVVEALRSKTPIQGERGSTHQVFREDGEFLSGAGSSKALNKNGGVTVEKKVAWSRSPYDSCRLPNKCLAKLHTDVNEDGCFMLKFSTNGFYLACGMRNDYVHFIVIFSIITFEEIKRYPIHQGLIYCIRWSNDDSLILTASADNTVAIYNFEANSIHQILPHPSFVYAVEMMRDNSTVASGCYDGIVRIWNRKIKEVGEETAGDGSNHKYNLFQELAGHRGYVTSMCFTQKHRLLSADSAGVIIEWKRENDDWELDREILLLEMKATVINHIQLFPKEKKFLVHSRDSSIRIVDLRTTCILQSLEGFTNLRLQLFSSLSPDGNLVFSGSEAGELFVWNAKNGHNLATYVPFSDKDGRNRVVHCVDFHPFDNIVAVSHYGLGLPILLLVHDGNTKNDNSDVNLKINVREEEIDSIMGGGTGRVSTLNPLRNPSKLHIQDDLSGGRRIDFRSVIRKMDAVVGFQSSET